MKLKSVLTLVVLGILFSGTSYSENMSLMSAINKFNEGTNELNCVTSKTDSCTEKGMQTCLENSGGEGCFKNCNKDPKLFCKMEKVKKCLSFDGGAPCYEKHCSVSLTSKFKPSNMSNSVNTYLPKKGFGFQCYDDHDLNVFGTPRTIERLKELGRRVKIKTGQKIFVGDISKKWGGYLWPHAGHRNGNEVDFANMGKTDDCISYNINDGCYSREANMALIETAIQMGGVKEVLFNDPVIRAKINKKYGPIMRYSRGHHHHIHITWN